MKIVLVGGVARPRIVALLFSAALISGLASAQTPANAPAMAPPPPVMTNDYSPNPVAPPPGPDAPPLPPPVALPTPPPAKFPPPGFKLQGKLIKGTFTDSKIFPGTSRDYSIYVPAEYDGSKPACVYIGQDGLNPGMAYIFDQLIASHQMPVTIGVFITPGSIKVPNPTNPKAKPIQVRINRSFEYNSVSDNYCRFVLDELLPKIEQDTNLQLSDSANDRCIGGGSSGSSIAFNTAWLHPEDFSRVLNVSGAFPFARGRCYSEVVRKTEPKPLRLYLHVGSNDMYNANGDLYMDNQKLASALEYAGYDTLYVVTDGKHMNDYMNAFQQAMIYLWKDWPAPVATVGPLPKALADILIPGEPWKVAAKGLGHVGGLTVDPKGDVIFSDTTANKIYRLGPEGQTAPFADDAQKVGALTSGADGAIYGVAESSGQVVAFDASGAAKVVASDLPGDGIVATRTGGFYVSVPGAPGTATSKIWYVSSSGDKKIVDTGLKGAAGLAISADDWLLEVADKRSHFVYSYQINADGTLSNREPYHWLEVPDYEETSEADGVALDTDNEPFVATNDGIQKNASDGRNEVILPLPSGQVTDVAFGGPNFDTLYAACGDTIYSRVVKKHGRYAFEPALKMGPPPKPAAAAPKPGAT